MRARALAKRHAELESGLPVRQNTPLDKAVANYFAARATELAASTLSVYRQATSPFLAWAKIVGLRFTDDLAPVKLMQFRVAFGLKEGMAVATGKGAGRGKRITGSRRRSPAQVNKCLRTLRTILSHWRRLGLTPRLDGDSIGDSLAYVRAPRPMGRILDESGIQRLLGAAIAHDASLFDLTRQEKLLGATKGATRRYDAIAPFIAAVLLTGCRVSEVLNLKWTDLTEDLGTLILTHTATKTHHARRVDLRVTPWLMRLLESLKKRNTAGPYVFGGESALPYSLVESARDRLMLDFGAPQFTWQTLRKTCGTFLACAPGVYGGASAYMAARRLGHSVDVAERHYLGVVSNLSPKARTLEAVLKIEKPLLEIKREMEAENARQDGTH